MGNISIPELPLLFPPISTIPVLGLGTAVYPFIASDDHKTKEAILNAIQAGYRHFDTAAAYQTEQVLGEAIGEALSLGLIKSRADLLVTSKLWCSDAHPHRVFPAIQNTQVRTVYILYICIFMCYFLIATLINTGL